MLNKIVKQLYNARGNKMFCRDFQNIDQEKLQELLDTPSKNKNLIKGLELTNCGYIMVKLTNLWIHYYENWYKLDKEIKETTQQISINYNSGNVAIWNNIQQEINVNEEIDKIITLIENKNVSDKEQIKMLLKEVKNEKNEEKQKEKLTKIIWILGNVSSVWQLLIAISHLLKI